MKRIILIIVCVIVVSGLIIKIEGVMEKKWLPSEQPGTNWSTEDGLAVFSVPNNNSEPIIGKIQADGKETPIQLFMGGLVWTIDVTYKLYSEGEIVYPDEFWHPQKVSKDTFVVTVEGSAFFEEGETLVFYKTK